MAQRDDAHADAWLVGAGILVLTLSSGAAACRAAGDAASIAFVLAGYVTLLLLLACVHAYERAPPGEAASDARYGPCPPCSPSCLRGGSPP